MCYEESLEERIKYIKELGFTFPENLINKILKAEEICNKASSYLFFVENSIGDLNGEEDEEYIKEQKEYIQECINKGYLFR